MTDIISDLVSNKFKKLEVYEHDEGWEIETDSGYKKKLNRFELKQDMSEWWKCLIGILPSLDSLEVFVFSTDDSNNYEILVLPKNIREVWLSSHQNDAPYTERYYKPPKGVQLYTQCAYCSYYFKIEDLVETPPTPDLMNPNILSSGDFPVCKPCCSN